MSTSSLDEVFEATARTLMERHLSRAKEWFPHQLVPWSGGRDFGPDDPGDAARPLPAGAASALWVGLLTEDNLPHYFHVIATAFAPDSAMGEWSRRWAAEEQRHATVIRDWVCVTRSLDLVALERARMRQLSTGFRAGARSTTITDGLVYLTLQELATRIAHWNTGELLEGSGLAIMRRVAADENLHFLFYREMVSAALRADPDGTVQAIERQVAAFEMPGAGIDGFSLHAAAIASAGVYDFKVHYEQVLLPVVLNHWGIETISGLGAEAEQARGRVVSRIARLKRVADRIEAQKVPAPG
ncbi:acyl-ACP desaturase [Acidiferrimicrobium sp. IK]|uniref:acyl-ACP desaturase n=1 Tax=Acidiferrimicrobium sp. IK TaxID=2871700 RepID=UPI0021CB3CE4|nr:acyl-ACP desaturase [Acidiferrimicrobium sp. IK]MCU4184426.1 acyl-ACP desaturase [Acidiferrimicrobium sp. IK]